jgi:hypothetical protein
MDQHIQDGMAVFDSTGRRVGEVETPTREHFFLARDSMIPVVRERIVVDVEASVESVDDAGVHLRHDRQELLARQTRPRDSKSSHEVRAHDDVSSVHRGNEDHRPLDADDLNDHA